MNHLRILSLALLLAGLAACQPKSATEAVVADTSPPIATVNGSPITKGFYDYYIKNITGKTPADLNPTMRATALDNLIHAKVVGG